MKEESKKAVKLELFPLTSTPTLLISEALKAEIDYLHGTIGKTEWSGELITSETGSIEDPEKWQIKGEAIYLADIGSSTYTEYEIGNSAFGAADVVAIYDKFPGLLEGTQKLQHIHSHHNMNAFFSGTDMDNLMDRASVSNYLLMLIVNFDGNYKAKVAFKGKVKGEKSGTIEFSNSAEKFKELKLDSPKEREVLITMDCNIKFEGAEVNEEFITRYNEVVRKKKELEEEKKKKEALKPKTFAYQNSELPWERYQEKKIHNMTQREWEKYEKKFDWERKHFHILVNAVIDGEVKGTNLGSAIFRLQLEGRKLLTEEERDDFCLTFQAKIREIFDVLYPDKKDDDYANLMELGTEILEPYGDNDPLIEEILQILFEEGMDAEGYTPLTGELWAMD